MTESVTVKTREQLLAAVGQVMGFHPTDSLVVVAIGGGPMARVDAGPLESVLKVLEPVLVHWSRVAVIGYGSGASLVPDLVVWLSASGVDVAVFDVAANGEGVGLRSGSTLDARHLDPTRAGIEAEALTISDPAVAQEMALTSYEVGNGARAWVYLNRWRALAGSETPEMADLEQRLVNAVDPRA